MDPSPITQTGPSGPSMPSADASSLGLEIVDVAELTAKRWWHSRTIIFNAVIAALLAAESQVNLLQPLLPVNVYALVAFALPVANAALRFVTATPIR